MTNAYKVYLTPEEHLDIKEYAEAHRHTFSSFCAYTALREIQRHPIRKDGCPIPAFAAESDYKELADRIRQYL